MMKLQYKPYQTDQSPVSYAQSQIGAGTSEVVFFLLALGILLKLGLAIAPAQVKDYQLNKLIAQELKRANDSKSTAQEFMQRLSKQLNINADYSTNAEEILTFTNKKVGSLEVRTNYKVVNNFFGNVDIVNRFEKDITMDDAK